MLNVFIGYDSREPVAYAVLCHSILRHATEPVSFTPLVQSSLRAQGLYTRTRGPLESTEFSLTRFLVPYLSGYEGVSIFLDCDMLVQDDIGALLAAVQPQHAVSVCQHDYRPSTATKMDGQRQSVYARKNWSSLMVFQNARCTALTPEVVNQAQPVTLHQFGWVREAEIGSVPLEWNWLVGEYASNAQAKILHYTLGGPWFRDYQHCDYANEWFDALDLAFPSMNVPKPVGV
jgi:hypothetical protein